MSNDERQDIIEAAATKSRKGLNFSINFNSVLTALVGFAVCGMWSDLRNAHDDLLTLKAQVPSLTEKVNSNTDSIKELWKYATGDYSKGTNHTVSQAQ